MQARAGCNAGTLTARSLVEAAARDVQARAGCNPGGAKADGQRGLVEAAAEGFRGFKV